TGQNAKAVQALTQAATLGREEASFLLADWYEQGRLVAKNADQATRLRVQGHAQRGNRLFVNGLFRDALPELQKVADSLNTDAAAYRRVGQCHGKLRQWSEAVVAYTRAFDLAPDGPLATSNVLERIEALILCGRPDEVSPFVERLEAQKWQHRPGT